MAEYLEPDPDHGGRPSFEAAGDADLEYAEFFAGVANALDRCEHSERVGLLISTCRNHYLTANAVFVDLRDVLGSGRDETEGTFVRATELLRRGDKAAKPILNNIRSITEEARLKFDVWDRRDELFEEFDAAVDEVLSKAAAQRLKRRLFEHGARPDARGWDWDPVFIGISPSPQPAGSEALAILLEVLSGLERVWRLCDLIADHFGAEVVTLFDGDPSSSPIEKLALELRENCGFWEPALRGTDADADAVAGLLVGELDRELQQGFATLLDAALVRLAAFYEQLQDSFRPNVAKAPMPDPFVIDLTPTTTQDSSPDQSYEVRKVHGGVSQPPDKVKVGLVGCGIPESWYNHGHHYAFACESQSPETRALEKLFFDALAAAEREGCALVVAPEYFMPLSIENEVLRRAAELGIGVIAGREGRASAKENKTINEAVVSLPGHLHLSVQRKQSPSVYEVKKARFDWDGVLQFFAGTVLGRLGVLVCSDYMELNIVDQLARVRDRLDTLIVCSRNPKPEVFERLARCDAVRLYAHVIVANSAPSLDTTPERSKANDDGTLIAVPAAEADHALLRADKLIELSPIAPDDLAERPRLHVFELDMSNVLGKLHGKPAKGWLSPSEFAST